MKEASKHSLSGDGGKNKPARSTAPEESVPLRVDICLMALVCIVIACSFVETSRLLTCIYVVAVIIGSYLSYLFRKEKNKWISALMPVVALAIMVSCGYEIYLYVLSGTRNFLPPLVHWLAAAFALHTFELRTNQDLSYSGGLGLGLICMTAPVARTEAFGACVVTYMCLGAFMLFYECQTRTSWRWLEQPPIAKAPLLATQAFDPAHRKRPAGAVSIFFTVLAIPVLSALLFRSMPRGDFLAGLAMSRVLKAYYGESTPNNNNGATNAPGGQANNSQPVGSQPGSAGNSGTTSSTTSKTPTEDHGMNIQSGLGDNSNQLLFRVRAGQSAFVRMHCYDSFDGHIWTVSGAASKATALGNATKHLFDLKNVAQFAAPKLAKSVDLRQRYTIVSTITKFLPNVWIPSQCNVPFGKLYANGNDALECERPLKAGTTYTVMSHVPIYDLQAMQKDRVLSSADQTSLRSKLANYLQLPNNLDRRISQLSVSIAGSGNWFDRALCITKYLRSNYRYLLLTESPTKTGAKDFTSDFLFTSKSGDCKRFATAMALMCRSIGIPARMVGGYAPGTLDAATGEFDERVRDGHAWVEVFVPKYGWVPFDATPSGYMPEFATREAAQQQLAKTSAKDPVAMWQFIRYPLIAVSVFVIALLVSALVYQQIRLRRKSPAHPASKVYRRTVAWLKRLKIVRRPEETPRELAQRVHEEYSQILRSGRNVAPELPDKFEKFVEQYQDCYFGNKKEQLGALELLSEEIKVLLK